MYNSIYDDNLKLNIIYELHGVVVCSYTFACTNQLTYLHKDIVSREQSFTRLCFLL